MFCCYKLFWIRLPPEIRTPSTASLWFIFCAHSVKLFCTNSKLAVYLHKMLCPVSSSPSDQIIETDFISRISQVYNSKCNNKWGFPLFIKFTENVRYRDVNCYVDVKLPISGYDILVILTALIVMRYQGVDMLPKGDKIRLRMVKNWLKASDEAGNGGFLEATELNKLLPGIICRRFFRN